MKNTDIKELYGVNEDYKISKIKLKKLLFSLIAFLFTVIIIALLIYFYYSWKNDMMLYIGLKYKGGYFIGFKPSEFAIIENELPPYDRILSKFYSFNIMYSCFPVVIILYLIIINIIRDSINGCTLKIQKFKNNLKRAEKYQKDYSDTIKHNDKIHAEAPIVFIEKDLETIDNNLSN